MEKPRSEDYELIDRFLSGEELAFEILVRKYQNRVINIVYSLCGATQHAEDIAQETFIKVHRSLKDFQKKAAFSTWLYRITVNTAYNYLKGKNRFVALEHIEKAQEFEKISLDHIESKERQRLISKAIENLPFVYRTVVVLKDIEGLAYADIAKTVGCSIGTVESRLFRARQILKKTLAPLLEEGRR